MNSTYGDAPLKAKGKRVGSLLRTAGLGLALCALLMLISAGLGTRFGLWHFRTGFAILGYAAYGGVAALLVALAGLVAAIKRGEAKWAAVALLAGVMALVAVAVPLSWQRTAQRLPRIHDISTDLDNPPRFVAIVPLRLGAANPVQYGGAEVAAQQRLAYPDLKTLVLNIPADQAFTRALAAAHRLHWSIVAAVADEGRIEATDTTFWFGFKDDIVIRITQADNHARVDIRSLSRVGVSDVGTNARRIRTFLKMLSA